MEENGEFSIEKAIFCGYHRKYLFIKEVEYILKGICINRVFNFCFSIEIFEINTVGTKKAFSNLHKIKV